MNCRLHTYKSGDVFPKLVMIGLIRNIYAAKLLCHVFACFALWLLYLLAFVAWRCGLVFSKLSPATWKLLLLATLVIQPFVAGADQATKLLL